MKFTYLHIFTDGLDKILSTSIWLSEYGKNDTFVYYTQEKLKGYISVKDIEILSEEGLHDFQNNSFITSLLDRSKNITRTVSSLHSSLSSINNSCDYKRLFISYVDVLRKGYELYFLTEEFRTTKLDPTLHEKLIETIGIFRLEFLSTNIQATKDIYTIAACIGKKYEISEEDVQFLTYQEVIQMTDGLFLPSQIDERKRYTLIRKTSNIELKYLFGQAAKDTYEQLVPTPILLGNIFEGQGASRGNVTGKVYIISLAQSTFAQAIEDMPNNAILVTESTQPDLVMACKKASAIVTNEGGILSHAAILARELHIPCVVGTRNATEFLRTGQMIQVDGEKGLITILS